MPLLGVNGICIKAHGNSLAQGDQECHPGRAGSRDSARSIRSIVAEINNTMTRSSPSPRLRKPPKRTVSIIATGAYLPERVLDQRRPREDGRDDATSGSSAARHPRAAHRRGGRIHHRHGGQGRAAGASSMGGIDAAGDRPDHRGHRHAGHVVPLHGLLRAAQDRRDARGVLRRQRGLLRLSLRASRSPQQFITAGAYETVLVIGADKLSSIVNWKDRNTCVLFGDGAGAGDPAAPRRLATACISTYMGATARRRASFPCPAAAAVFRSRRRTLDAAAAISSR